MEFYDLGKHCFEQTCHQKDFLPIKCDKCYNHFCQHHYEYENHRCEKHSVELDKNVQDVQEKTKENKVKRKRCFSKKCRERTLLMECRYCHQNVCLNHRDPEDHKCSPYKQVQEVQRANLKRNWSQIKSNKSLLTNPLVVNGKIDLLHDKIDLYKSKPFYNKIIQQISEENSNLKKRFVFLNSEKNAICSEFRKNLTSSNSRTLRVLLPLETGIRPLFVRAPIEWTVEKIIESLISGFELKKKDLEKSERFNLYGIESGIEYGFLRSFRKDLSIKKLIDEYQVKMVILEKGSFAEEEPLKEEIVLDIITNPSLPRDFDTCKKIFERRQKQLLSNFNPCVQVST